MNYLSNKKLNAGALQYTMFISVLVMLLVLALIAMAHVQQKLRIKNQLFTQLVHENAMVFSSLKNPSISGVNPWPNSSIHSTRWGLFDLVSVHSKKNKESVVKTAIMAGHKPCKPALYLLDEQQPLVLVGRTEIRGNALLPEQGVKPGSIAGRSYNNSQLIFGSISKSKSVLPAAVNLDKLYDYIDSIQSGTPKNTLELTISKKQVHSFTEPTQELYSRGTLILKDLNLTGNMLIRSDSKIVIEASTLLHDLLIVAPEIEIKAGVKGNFQAIAENKISVGKEVSLDYPSALIVMQRSRFLAQSVPYETPFKIEEKAQVKGIVAFLNTRGTTDYQTQLLLDKEAEVYGELYCEQNLELKGKVYGSVYTRGFIVREQGSVYKNHLYNTQIIASDLPEEYAGISFENTKLTVAKWLY